MDDDASKEGKPMRRAGRGKTGRGTSPRAATGDAAFNEWLKRGLEVLYGGATQEPVPDELLKLIEQDRRK